MSIRKQGKKLAIYDLTIEIKWTGKAEGSEDAVEGTIKIGEFASESDEDDWLIECTTIQTGENAVCPTIQATCCALLVLYIQQVVFVCRTHVELWLQIN